jgi:iron complex transport system substrate-binding protein
VLLALVVSVVGCAKDAPKAAIPGFGVAPPMRIVSLAPSVTEILYELGLGDRVVGVTRYCDYPPEVIGTPAIGGYLDVNYEAIVSLEPDLIVGIQDNTGALNRLNDLGLETLQVDQHDVAGIVDSIRRIGDACGTAERAHELGNALERHIDRIQELTSGLDRPRTLVVVDRRLGTGTVRTVWVAGPTTFYNEILELAGGSNAIEDGVTVYPELSVEGLVAADPDAIIEVTAELDARGMDAQSVLAEWMSLTTLRAVRSNRVHVFDQEWMVIPGPRVAGIVSSFARVLHPEMNWTSDG